MFTGIKKIKEFHCYNKNGIVSAVYLKCYIICLTELLNMLCHSVMVTYLCKYFKVMCFGDYVLLNNIKEKIKSEEYRFRIIYYFSLL